MQRRTPFTKLVTACSLVATAGCASDRAHWSGGRKFDLAESSTLHARRSRQSLDEARSAIEIAWIGARAKAGAADLSAVELTIFDDENGDGRAQDGEIAKRCESRERARKVQFAGLRWPWNATARPLKALLVVHSADDVLRASWTIVPD